jgi:hypothetical protein
VTTDRRSGKIPPEQLGFERSHRYEATRRSNGERRFTAIKSMYRARTRHHFRFMRLVLSSVLAGGALIGMTSILPNVFGQLTPAGATGSCFGTFNYDDAAQSCLVPAGVWSIEVDVRGAQGYGYYGGFGGRVQA